MALHSSKIVEMLDKEPLPEIYNTIFYTVHAKYATNKYGYAKIESSQLSTKIWSMACYCEALLNKEKQYKPSTYWDENLQINWKEKGSADVKQTENLLITVVECRRP